MATCPKCGAEISEDDKFCGSCGASLAVKTNEKVVKESEVKEREVCFGERERRRDYLGLVSFGIFIVIVGLVFLANPNVASNFGSWIEQMSREKTLRRPPQDLIDSAILIFCLIGLSNFFVAGIRFMTDKVSKVMRRVLADILTGVALVLFSYLIYLYGSHALAWQMVPAIEAVAVGLLVIFYSLVRYLFPTRLQ